MGQFVKKDMLMIEGARLFQEDGWLENANIYIRDGRIEEISQAKHSADQVISGHGLHALPGIIDLHGDGFEYHMAPRAGVHCPIDMAVMANDMALISSGITTFYYSITDGFETGVRSRETVRKILAAIDRHRPDMRCDVRIHIRHEQANTEDHEELLDWIRKGRIDLLSLNNHLPLVGDEKSFERYIAGFKRRVSADLEEARQMVETFQSRLPLGAAQTREIAELCRARGVSLASHDNKSIKDTDESLQLGVRIAEFPMTTEIAKRFREEDVHVLMGSPNAVRGSSHVNAVGVRDALKAGAVDILCSDYHYPSLFKAPFLMAELGIVEFHQAWKMVSENPADAAGLAGRKGRLKEGMDADMLLVSGFSGLSHELKSVMVGAKMVHHSF